MKKITLSAIAVLSLASTLPSVLSADDGFSLFSNTKWNGEVRARYENVDVEDSNLKNANAYTVRATLGLEASLFGLDGLSMKIDGTTVQSLSGTDYNGYPGTDTTHHFKDYQTVIDPEQTRFTQAYLQYKYGATALKAGRQIMNIDNQRFIGSVDWRQMMQSMDAVTLTNSSIDGLSLTASYIYGYATIFDERTQDSDSVLLNGNYKIADWLKITAYDYMLSLEKGQFAADTYGVALTGDIPAGIAKINYRAEYALQDDSTFKTTTTNVKKENSASYYNLDALANISGILVGAGYEVLSGAETNNAGAIIDGKTAFSTPLATLHKFNGWADKFLATPTGGLCDTSATIGYTAPGLGKAMIVYHDFETDKSMKGYSDLGSEWDMLYTNAVPGVKGLNGLVKAAYFEGGDVATYTKDATKIWLELDYKF